MSSNMDSRDRGKGDPPMKPSVEGGYQQRYRDPRRENKRPAKIRPSRATFNGLTEDLKGHIYDMGTEYQADQFTATTKALDSYAERKCSDPQDIRITIERQKDVVIQIPTSRLYIEAEVAKLLLRKDIDGYVKRSQQYRQNKAKIYSVALGQCTEATKNRLKGEETYEDIDEESDAIRLLLIIKRITYSYESKSYPVLAIHTELKNSTQATNQTCHCATNTSI